MALDRDLSVALVTAALADRADALGVDLLAATGARGLRLLSETGRFARMVLVEGHPFGVARLASHSRATDPARAEPMRANAARSPLRSGAFDYVDVDPYGTPIPFLEEAIRIARPGALLAITATDMPVLCGVSRDVAERRYGGRPVRGRLGPEGGLRLLLATVARAARARQRSAGVVAAYVHDHHVRALLRLGPPTSAPDPVERIDPRDFAGPRLPPGPPIGPLWTGPLFDGSVVERAVPPRSAARPREVHRWLKLFRGECRIVAPFYYETNLLARDLHLPSPARPRELVERLRSHGFGAALSHVRPGAIRTPAPRTEVESIARALPPVRGGGEDPPPSL